MNRVELILIMLRLAALIASKLGFSHIDKALRCHYGKVFFNIKKEG